MEYRRFGKLDIKVSPLGFGMMRLPVDASKNIDEKQTARMVHQAIEKGLNYIDTAYSYKGSELVTGKVLKGGYREKVYLATKSPVWLAEKPEDFQRFLDESLKALDTDYIDFYMLHSLDSNLWKNKVVKYDLVTKIIKARESGKIRYIGFSFHDNLDLFREITDITPEWDFTQIQLNYLDTRFQAGLEGLAYAAGKGLGVIIMEPLRGGYLADVPDNVQQVFANSGRTAVEWALDYLWNMPQVSVVLSGMSNMQQTEDNLAYMQRAKVGMLTKKDLDIIKSAQKAFADYETIPCTGCGYCSSCPQHIAVPHCFTAYNNWVVSRDLLQEKAFYYRWDSTFGQLADKCIGCKKCESHCPQHLPISKLLKKVDELFRQ